MQESNLKFKVLFKPRYASTSVRPEVAQPLSSTSKLRSRRITAYLYSKPEPSSYRDKFAKPVKYSTVRAAFKCIPDKGAIANRSYAFPAPHFRTSVFRNDAIRTKLVSFPGTRHGTRMQRKPAWHFDGRMRYSFCSV